ncbi:hypothetical protein PLESTM_002075300 [Pleodorina starrii]|nr:hypothetical protein PLESTM_002075300 [Pleodorina starrii]
MATVAGAVTFRDELELIFPSAHWDTPGLGSLTVVQLFQVILFILLNLVYLRPHIKHATENRDGRRITYAVIADATGVPPDTVKSVFEALRDAPSTLHNGVCVLEDLCSAVDDAGAVLGRLAAEAASGYSHVRLAFARDYCYNPDCEGVKNGAPPKLHKDGTKTPVDVVTIDGILVGMQEGKECRTCKATYYPNHYTIDGGKTVRHHTGPGFTIDFHPFIRTQGNHYWGRDALNWVHHSKYFLGAADAKLAQIGNAWRLWRVFVRCLARHEVYEETRGQEDDRARIRREVELARHDLPHAQHECQEIGCGGCVPMHEMGLRDNQPLGQEVLVKPDIVVIDANTNLKFHVCAERECGNVPVDSKHRFCHEHRAFETVCAAWLETQGQYCMAPCAVLPSGGLSKCCSRHQSVEQKFLQAWYHRKRKTRPLAPLGPVAQNQPRAQGRAQAQAPTPEDEFEEKAAMNRLTRSYTHGTMVAARGCGIVLAYHKCKHGERIAPTVAMLQRLYPEDKAPDHVVYDRTCFVYRYMNGTNCVQGLVQEGYGEGRSTEELHAIVQKWRQVDWVVDRFHFAGHRESDEICRKHCNPYSVELPAFTRVLHKRSVDSSFSEDEKVAVMTMINASPLEVGFKCQVQVEEESGITHSAKGRRVFCVEGVSPSNPDGQLWEYQVLDQFNTEVCEQTFGLIEHFGDKMRLQEADNAEFYFQEMVTLHNNCKTSDLEQKNKSPTQLSDADAWVDASRSHETGCYRCARRHHTYRHG